MSTHLNHSRTEQGVHILELNTPEAFNVLSEGMMAEMRAVVEQVENDAQSRALVIRAAGKAFCAGHDLRQMRAHPSQAYYQKLFAECARLMLSLQALPVPVIARVQGVATAAGCQLVAQCDLAVAARSARFGVNGIDLGLFCATPSVALSRNIGSKASLHMLMTGDFISAEQALQHGLLNEVVEADELDAAIERLLSRLLAKPRLALAMGKRMFYAQREMGMAAAYQLAGQSMACNMAHDVAQEGVQAFIEKRNPVWPA